MNPVQTSIYEFLHFIYDHMTTDVLYGESASNGIGQVIFLIHKYTETSM